MIRIPVDTLLEREKTKVHSRSVVDLYDIWSQSSYEQTERQNSADQMEDLFPGGHSVKRIS